MSTFIAFLIVYGTIALILLAILGSFLWLGSVFATAPLWTVVMFFFLMNKK